MKLSRKQRITQARRMLTAEENKTKEGKTSIWNSAWYNSKKAKIKIMVRNRETIARVKAEDRRNKVKEGNGIS